MSNYRTTNLQNRSCSHQKGYVHNQTSYLCRCRSSTYSELPYLAIRNMKWGHIRSLLKFSTTQFIISDPYSCKIFETSYSPSGMCFKSYIPIWTQTILTPVLRHNLSALFDPHKITPTFRHHNLSEPFDLSTPQPLWTFQSLYVTNSLNLSIHTKQP